LLSAFLLLIVMLVSALGHVLLALDAQAQATDTIVDRLEGARSAARELIIATWAADSDGADYLLADDRATADEKLRAYAADLERVSHAFANAKANIHSEVQRAALAAFDRGWNGEAGYVRANAKAFSLRKAGHVSEARARWITKSNSPTDKVEKYSADVAQVVHSAIADVHRLQRLAMAVGATLGLGPVLLAFLIAYVVAGSLVDRVSADRHQAEQELTHSAFHDDLTGLPNRALFRVRLTQALARNSGAASRVGVVFLGCDRFKLVNDTHGHLIGDTLLVAIARRLETCVTAGETLARLGGDEFTILFENVPDEAAAARIAERIRAALAEPFALSDHDAYPTASIGIVLRGPGRQHRICCAMPTSR